MADEPIKVSANAGLIDGIQAAARYAVVIVGFVTAILGLLKTRDIGGMIVVVQNNGGEVLSAIAGLIALATAAYGVFKSGKRGGQLATAATDPDVPDSS
jgi:hypothetical protein